MKDLIDEGMQGDSDDYESPKEADFTQGTFYFTKINGT